MATADVLPSHTVPSANRVEPGSYTLKAAQYPQSSPSKNVDPGQVVLEWVNAFNDVIKSADYERLSDLFWSEAYWRDQLCLSWDYHTLATTNNIISFLTSHPSKCRLTSLHPDTSSPYRSPKLDTFDFVGQITGVQSYLTLTTDIGTGRGIVRICQDPSDNRWKAFTLFTAMHSLTGHEEPLGKRRPEGVIHGANPGRMNWKDRREREKECAGEEGEPDVVILGCGQAGLTVAARLKMLGVRALVVDRMERVGDSWRKRYHQLVLHDPVWYDHLPYIPFPDMWPIFTPKDKLGDWFESYANSMELNVWLSTTLTNANYDETSKRWTVELERPKDGKAEKRTLHPRFVIQATGHSGEKNFPSHIPHIQDGTFRGDLLCHSSEFPGARPHSTNRKAIVVGCCNSGHDIAQDYYENGYDVTMIQRSTTCVITNDSSLGVSLRPLYCEGGPPTEDADLAFMSVPLALLKNNHIQAHKEIQKRDAKIREGLKAAGFALDDGPDDAGLFMKYFQRGGGYYIDVGAAQLIADKKIKIKQGQEVEEVTAKGLRFRDGVELEADEIVFATGYSNMRDTCRRIFGDSVADKVDGVWGFDKEGEVRTLWRRTGHEGLFFMAGNLALCRYYSRMLALQIKGQLEGMYKPGDL